MEAARRRGQPPPSLLAAVLLVSFSVLAFEVALTRCFSVLLRYHFVFLVLSMAVCGLGVGGLLDFLLFGERDWVPEACRRHPAARLICGALGLWPRALLRRWAQTPWRVLTFAALGYGLLLPLIIVLLFRTGLSGYLTSLWVVGLVCFVPLCAAGLFLSHVFGRFSGWAGRLYGADLAGAALGALLVLVALQFLGGTNAILALGAVACLSATLIAWQSAELR